MTTKTRTTQDLKSTLKVLAVMKVLTRNMAHGFSSSELARETGLSASDITRYVNTLENAGFAERIAETGRIRPSIWFAKSSLAMLHSIDQAQERLGEIKQRMNRG
ncbi:helix-turn-helix domain-containing protein [Methylomicrobium sp. Wu6]|uniref:helix-turn-helix domain-containing protein n=1 Tax=Methylomicrobium sp. Wu6 TaxID=3107928 RepID=UPI002DD638AF|nr:helix-turn-helix domain-containing protein [Methylomicrobium sp. Wu6]MEC4750031.1 helix-turn-helix domain-containing protein [Methylomicrobium sp. Wu6]